jgi:hypothetical protein
MALITSDTKSPNFQSLIFIPASLWMFLLMFLPATQRYFTSDTRILCVAVTIFVLLLLLLCLRGWKLLCALPLGALIVFFTIGMCRHPYYSLIDYLLYNSKAEERAAYDSLCESGANLLIGEGHITCVDFEGIELTEKQWQSLRSLPKLQTIDFSHTNITDENLQRIKALVQLEYIDLGETKVTGSAVKNLQKALPNLKIKR